MKIIKYIIVLLIFTVITYGQVTHASQRDDHLHMPFMTYGTTPESNLEGDINDFCLDTVNVVLYWKATGAGTTTGWVEYTSSNVADADYGEITVASGVWTVDDDVVGSEHFKDQDWGDITISLNVASVEDNSHLHDGTSISGLAVADFTSPNISNWTNDSGYIVDIIEDITPQLGGNLDIQAFNIEGVDATEFSYVDPTSSIQTQFNNKQPLDGALTAISSLVYVSPSFIKMTANDTYAVRTLAETKADLSIDNVTNVATSDVAYNATSWNTNLDNATKNSIRDKINTMDTAIGLNTAKNTNVPTALSEGTRTATTYGITSDGGADDLVMPEANTTNAGLLGADKWDEIGSNTLKVTNATHTGDVTGATVLTISPSSVDIAMLSASGTPTATSFLRGDNAWATPAGSGNVSTSGAPAQYDIARFVNATDIEGRSYAEVKSDLDLEVGTDFYSISSADATFAPAQSQGLTWDESADTYTRTGSISDIATGISAGSDRLIIQSAMRRCILNDYGEVVYYLGAANSAVTEFGGVSTLDGTDGQVMVQIPKFYYKYSYAGTTHSWSISPVRLPEYNLHPAFYKNGEVVDYRYIGAYEATVDVNSTGKLFSCSGVYPTTTRDATGETPAGINLTAGDRDNFRTYGENRGTGWRQLDYDLASAVQLLYLVEYANFNSQSMIGAGRTTLTGGAWVGGSYIGITGLSNSDGNGTNAVQVGALDDVDYMTYRGIENFFGNIWKFVDGININDNIPYVSNNATNWADDTATNYIDLNITLHNANGYQSTLEQVSRGFLPASIAGGSSSAKITDYYYQSTGWRVFLLGGGAYYGSYAGVFYLYAYSASSDANASIGGRVCF